MTPEVWSPGGQIQYLDGYAYSINPALKTVCLGTEEEVRKAIESGKGNRLLSFILEVERKQLSAEAAAAAAEAAAEQQRRLERRRR